MKDLRADYRKQIRELEKELIINLKDFEVFMEKNKVLEIK